MKKPPCKNFCVSTGRRNYGMLFEFNFLPTKPDSAKNDKRTYLGDCRKHVGCYESPDMLCIQINLYYKHISKDPKVQQALVSHEATHAADMMAEMLDEIGAIRKNAPAGLSVSAVRLLPV